jgi:predicted nucleotidyltransferase
MARENKVKEKKLGPELRILFNRRLQTLDEKKKFYDDKIAIAKRCAIDLYAKGAVRVWLFGSLAEGNHIDHFTDIDIAVEGLKKPVLDIVQRSVKAREQTKIDIVCLETTNPGFRNQILKKRVLLGKGKVSQPNI